MPTNAPVRPFAGLLTPETLKARRAAENEAAYADQSFWVKRAAKYGEDLRESMRSIGYGLDEEDAKAAAHAALLQSVMGDAKTLIDAGELTPDEAQGYVMQQSMTALMNAGDYEAAAEIAPQLTEWQKGRLELGKIKSEIDENAADRFKSLASGEKSLGDLRLAGEKLPLEKDKLIAETAANTALAGLRNRTDPNIRAGKGATDPDMEITPTLRIKAEQQLASTMTAFQQLGGLYQLLTDQPGVSAGASEFIAPKLNELAGIGNLFRSQQDAGDLAVSSVVEKEAASKIDAAYERQNPSGLLGRRGSNAQAFVEYKSRTMDLAYALAKARDPGGRLSNADVDNALAILGASGDAKAMRRVLERVGAESYKSIQNLGRASPAIGRLPGMKAVDEEYAKFQELVSAAVKGEQAKPASPGKPARSAAERAAIVERARKRLREGK